MVYDGIACLRVCVCVPLQFGDESRGAGGSSFKAGNVTDFCKHFPSAAFVRRSRKSLVVGFAGAAKVTTGLSNLLSGLKR